MKHSKLAKALLSVIVLACFGQSVNVAAQDPPLSGCVHVPPTDKPGWPQGTTVNVWIDPAITGGRVTEVGRGFKSLRRLQKIPYSCKLVSQNPVH